MLQEEYWTDGILKYVCNYCGTGREMAEGYQKRHLESMREFAGARIKIETLSSQNLEPNTEALAGPAVGHMNEGPAAGHMNDGPAAGHMNDGPTIGHMNDDVEMQPSKVIPAVGIAENNIEMLATAYGETGTPKETAGPLDDELKASRQLANDLQALKALLKSTSEQS
ncbi:hypothetical protein PtA15_6A773 [Puccinia triticina]|uniref:BED-type domain-containing protein n=1 Tax=Puccinia triticina TaxID=208348 RepID=A0ABY7CP70_9BASI|nr:uncharacterized protein PtA15_6A773 [Puccinia triticina]WAQ86143.1 hypothetical protein PtA15_6A773 [Puccinia triticina]